MLSSKFVITLIGLIMAVLAICNLNFGEQPVVENFWGAGSFAPRAMPVARNTKTGQETALGVSVLSDNTMGSGKFVQVPNYQAVISPRFSNINYGANIKYNLPSHKNMAVPHEPLDFGGMAEENYNPPSKEGYCGGGNGLSCGKGGYGMGHKVGGGNEVPPGYTNGNKQQLLNDIPASSQNIGSQLPVGTMTTMDGAGNQEQFVTYNSMMFAQLKPGRNYSGSDPIRGDLAISPCNQGWFSVYPDLTRDLNPGAMGVLAGAGEGGVSNNATLDLLVKASGGTRTTWGGVDLSNISPQSVNQNAQTATNLSAGLSDIQVQAFP